MTAPRRDSARALHPTGLSPLAAVLSLVLVSAACGGGGSAATAPRATLSLLDLVAADGTAAPGVSLPGPARRQRVASGLDWREALVTPVGTLGWDLTVPAGGRLHLGVESLAIAGAEGDPHRLELTVAVEAGGRRKALYVASPKEIDAPDWLDLELPLERWEGRAVRLLLEARPVGGRDPRPGPAELAWSPLRVVAAPAAGEAGAPPSILLIVIDTLRADALAPYDGPRWNSPNIVRELARPGIVFESAYAQAPWTLPSMVSLLTGVVPGVLLGSQAASFGIPAEQPSLPERLRQAGYETAAFIGNPTLHQGNGFGRGLDRLYISPAETAFVASEDELLTSKATRWLAARGERPYYLHVHYLAPHDPYVNPVQILGRSPRHPFYFGRIKGTEVHDLFLGSLELDDPEEDVAQLRALYGSEVRWVDRWVGELLGALSPQQARDTLVVLTSDHGEELYEHGSWKHGRTLYEEQLRVPLLVRWREAADTPRRVSSPVRLVDVAPTLLDAAGIAMVPGTATGRSLLPILRRGGEPEPEEVYAERLNFGPPQVAVVADRRKLILFDRLAASPLEGEMQEEKVAEEAEREPRIALYDLARDPRESRNLVAEAPELLRRLTPGVHRGLDQTTPGLRVVAGRLPPGSWLEVTVRFARAPAEWRSYFLAGGDHALLEGTTLRLDLGSDVIEKGVLVLGDWGAVESVEALLDREPVDPSRIWRPGAAEQGRMAPAAASEAAGAARPLDVDALTGEAPSGAEAQGGEPPLVYLWVPASGATEPAAGRPDAETLHRLRALGYL